MQAQVRTVIAYTRIYEIGKAITLFDYLIKSSNPQLQEWAECALEHLNKVQKRHKKTRQLENGFVAMDLWLFIIP